MQAESGEWTLMIAGSRLEPGSAPSSDDTTELLRQAKAGSNSAFEQILLLHQRQVLMTSLRLLGDLKDVQDAGQEVFLRLFKYLHRFDDTREFRPWLYRMTVNVCRDIQRKRQKGVVTLSLEDIHQRGGLMEPVSSSDPEADLSLSEKRKLVSEALKKLPEKERAAIVLRDIEGLSTREVARILGSSEVTVRSQVSSARVKIKKFIETVQKKRS